MNKKNRYEQIKFFRWQPRNFENEFTVFATDDEVTEMKLCRILDKEIGNYVEVSHEKAIDEGLYWPEFELRTEGQWNGGFCWPGRAIGLDKLQKMIKHDEFEAVELALEGTKWFIRGRERRENQ